VVTDKAEIQSKILALFEQIKAPIAKLFDSYVIDFAVLTDGTCKVVELNPYVCCALFLHFPCVAFSRCQG
jgi:hypothetical protein